MHHHFLRSWGTPLCNHLSGPTRSYKQQQWGLHDSQGWKICRLKKRNNQRRIDFMSSQWMLLNSTPSSSSNGSNHFKAQPFGSTSPGPDEIPTKSGQEKRPALSCESWIFFAALRYSTGRAAMFAGFVLRLAPQNFKDMLICWRFDWFWVICKTWPLVQELVCHSNALACPALLLGQGLLPIRGCKKKVGPWTADHGRIVLAPAFSPAMLQIVNPLLPPQHQACKRQDVISKWFSGWHLLVALKIGKLNYSGMMQNSAPQESFCTSLLVIGKHFFLYCAQGCNELPT